MLDRLFMPALTFTLLVAATAAFAVEFSSDQRQSASPAPIVVMLERVVVTAPAADRALARAERDDEVTATR
jgi:hypothetical protein